MPETQERRLRQDRGQRKASPGLAFVRLLSREGMHPLDAVQWTHRDLSADDMMGASALRDVEMPAAWSPDAALSFLLRHAPRAEQSPEEKSTSVRAVMVEMLDALCRRGLEGGYFVRLEDAEIFAEELGALLLSQGAALTAPFPRAGEDEQWPVLLSEDAPEVEVFTRSVAGGRPAVLLVSDPTMLQATESASSDATVAPATLLRRVAERVAVTGEPALSFLETVRRWHTAPATAGLESLSRASACAGTLNLTRFVTPAGDIDLPALRHAVALLTTALELQVDARVYGSDEMTRQAREHRQLALGFGGLGEALMSCGLSYDSEAARRVAAAISALLCADGVLQSARTAETCPATEATGRVDTELRGVAAGACLAYAANRDRALAILRQRRAEAYRVGPAGTPATSAEMGTVIPFAKPAGRVAGTDLSLSLTRQIPTLLAEARAAWDAALLHAEQFGLRNMELTGLIAGDPLCVDMDCETVGAEPEQTLMLEERRAPSTSGVCVRPRTAVAAGLFRLGYSGVESDAILQTMEQGQRLTEVPFLRAEHRPVFFSAAAESADERVTAIAVVQMLGAVQPFVGGANPHRLRVQERVSAESARNLLLAAWRAGLKAVRIEGTDIPEDGEAEMLEEETPVSALFANAIREAEGAEASAGEQEMGMTHSVQGSENEASRAEGVSDTTRLIESAGTLAEAEDAVLARDQAALLESQLHRIAELEVQMLALRAETTSNSDAFDAKEPPRSVRHRLPAERASVTHKFSVAGQEGYITVGLYPNGSPGEIFLRMGKANSLVAGLLDSFALTASLALQHGVPLRTLADHLMEMRFEPSGESPNPQIPYARSVMEYLFRWLELRFLSGDQMDLFSGLQSGSAPSSGVPVTGHVTGPTGTVVPRLVPPGEPRARS